MLYYLYHGHVNNFDEKTSYEFLFYTGCHVYYLSSEKKKVITHAYLYDMPPFYRDSIDALFYKDFDKSVLQFLHKKYIKDHSLPFSFMLSDDDLMYLKLLL